MEQATQSVYGPELHMYKYTGLHIKSKVVARSCPALFLIQVATLDDSLHIMKLFVYLLAL